MKKVVIAGLLFCFGIGNAQTTIVEGVFEKGKNMPYNYYYLSDSDKLILVFGKEMPSLANIPATLNRMESFSVDGKREMVFENENIGNQIYFSPSQKTIRVSDLSTSSNKPKKKYFNEGKFSGHKKVEKGSGYVLDNFGTSNFSDKFIFSLTNQKDDTEVDFLKDEITLKVEDIFSDKTDVFNLQKPDFSRLIGPNFIELERKLGFKLYPRTSEGFDLVTKSISNDYKKTILYATNYSNEGKIKGEKQFNLELQNNCFVYSNNDASFIYRTANNKSYFNDDLFINNFFVDQQNGDVYIYGLYGDEASKLTNLGKPMGYYVFKFDQKGNKIWESLNKINDKHFNSKNSLKAIKVDLEEINNNLCLTVSVNENKEYIIYGIVDKLKGEVTKSNNIVYHQEMTNIGFNSNYFIRFSGEFEDDKELKNKKFDTRTMVAMDYNPKISEYIRTKKSKNELNFASVFSDKGIWLIETDNKDYYKVTLY